MSYSITVQNKEIEKEKKVFLPPVNVYETKDKIIIFADMPGVDEKSVDITLENNILTFTGKTSPENNDGYQLTYSEYVPGDYRRSFNLSSIQIQRNAIEAFIKNGTLKVVLPKSEETQAKKIEVKSN